MPNLNELFSLCNSGSYYSRGEQDVWSSINSAGFRLYTAVLKEYRGFFLKFDTSSLTLVPGTEEYTLPADFSQLVQLAERQASTEDWHSMSPIDLQTELTQQLRDWGIFSWRYGSDSPFGYYGPYLTSAQAVSTQLQKIRVAPAVDMGRFCQLVYTAKWLPIRNASSTMMLPDEGTYALQDYATAELLRKNGDSMSAEYEAMGDRKKTEFLTWMRDRQIQQLPTVKAYLI
jgi:hypothetical protein